MARRSSIQSGTTKSLVYSIVCMLAGVALIFIAVMTWQDPADCGGQTMQQGDTCEVTQNGSTSDNSMSQQESANHREAVIMFVLGPLLIVGGAFWCVSEVRIRRRRAYGAPGSFQPGEPPRVFDPSRPNGYVPGPAPQPLGAQGRYGVPQGQYGAAQPQAQQQPPQFQPQPQFQTQPQAQQPPQFQTQPQPQAYGAPPQQGWQGGPQQQGWPGQQQPQQPPQGGSWQQGGGWQQGR